jgi:hypothetical protein
MRRAVAVCAVFFGLLPAQALAVGPDFNNDGADDLAVGVPAENVGHANDVGVVHVLYGATCCGLTAGELWMQDSPGIAEQTSSGERFGEAVAWGDADNDGFDDLVIAAPNENRGSIPAAGVVHVLYGSPSGLTAARSQLWHQNVTDIADGAERLDRFGAAVAMGDVNGDGFDDLLSGVPGEGGVGAVSLIKGSPTGLTAMGDQLVSQDSTGAKSAGEPGDSYGAALAAGDTNGDGRDDAVVGVPGEDVGAGIVNAGAIQVVPGAAGGLAPSQDKFLSQDTAGVQDAAEPGDAFGSVLTTGRFDADAREDVAVGVPAEQQPDQEGFETGAVHVLYGSAGLTGTARAQYFTQDTPGLSGSDPSEPEEFGSALAAADFDPDGLDDLAVGSPGEEVGPDVDAGQVTVLYATTTGLSTARARFFTQDSQDVVDPAEGNDAFGATLGDGDFDGNGIADLAVGVPDETTVGGVHFAGALNTLLSFVPRGLSGAGGQYWNQSSPGVPDFPEPEDHFAAALTG